MKAGQLAARLRDLGYDETAFLRILQVPDLPGLDPERLPGLVRRCRQDGSPAAALLAFWMLLEPGDPGVWLGQELVADLLERQLIEPAGGLLRACCQLVPFQGCYLFTKGVPGRDLALARATPRARGERALDLGTGWGLGAILNSQHHEQSFGLESIPFFPELNALVNGAACAWTGELPEGDFDLITACAPWPAPARGALPRDDHLTQLVEALAPSLRVGGLLALATSYLLGPQPPLERLQELLGPLWGLAQLTYASCPGEQLAAQLADRSRLLQAFGREAGEQAYELEVHSRLESFQRVRVRGLADALFFLRRLSSGGWSRVWTIPPPCQEMSGLVERRLQEAGEPDLLTGLAERLSQAGYREAGLRALLQLPEALFLPEQRPGLLFRCQGPEPLARLCAFWLLGRRLDPPLLDSLMGQPVVQELSRLGLIQEGAARAHLFPCLEHYFFTDLMGQAQDQVYWLGPDSLALARCVPRSPRGRALDLCTGSGVQAILNATHCRESWGVDLNPRALEFCRINARLNGVRCHFLQGDLYDPLPPGRFDLITANPPFVPTPRGDLQLFRPGGESGEEVTAAMVAGLAEHLEVGGTLALVSQCPILGTSDPLDRLESWLGGVSPRRGDGRGGKTGWGLAQLNLGGLDRDSLIASHLHLEAWQEGYRQEFERWLDSYERIGIQGAELAVTFVRRLEPGQAGWRAQAASPMPAESLSDWVEAWLRAQD